MEFGIEWGTFSIGLAVGGFFLGLSFKADDLISEKAGEDLSEYLRSSKPHKTIKTVNLWPKIFIELFDKVFGEKHFSFKCFFRSAIASILAFCICLAVMFVLIQNSLAEGQSVRLFEFKNSITSNALKYYATIGFLVLSSVTFLNVVVDFLSLLETRYIIGRIEQTESAIMQLGWVVFDFFATGLIYFLYLVTLLIIFFPERVSLNSDLFERTYDFLVGAQYLNSVLDFYKAAFWTTFFTSLWVWLYFLAQMLTRFVAPLSKTVNFLRYLLPINSYPLRAVCTVMAIIACVGTWIILLPSTVIG